MEYQLENNRSTITSLHRVTAMENKASKTRSIKIAFVLDPPLLKRLETILSEVGDVLEYTLKFSDGSSVQYSNVEEIIEQPNSTKRAIISLIAGTTQGEQSAYVTLRTVPAPPSPSVEYTINGTQRDVVYIADQLDDWTAAIRQWYTRILSGPWSGAVILAAFAFPLWVVSHLPAWVPRQSSLWAFAVLAAIGYAEYWFLKLFPYGVFAIGQGVRRYRFLGYVRNTLLAGFVVSFLASLLADWIRH